MKTIKNRKEIVYRPKNSGLGELEDFGFQIKEYHRPYTTTIYFGGTSELWEGLQLLSHASVKARMYSHLPYPNYFIIQNDIHCIFEIKTRPDDYELRHVRKKVRNIDPATNHETEIPLIHIMSEIDRIISSGATTSPFLSMNVIDALLQLKSDYKLKSLQPIAATSYERSHYYKDNVKINLDRTINYYKKVDHEQSQVFVKMNHDPGPLIEVKYDPDNGGQSFRDTMHSFMDASELIEVTGDKSKGSLLAKFCSNDNDLEFKEPELKLKATSHWDMVEREIKIDLDKNPHTLNLEAFSIAGFFLLPSNSALSYLQFFYSTNGKSYCTMQFDLNSDSSKVLKYKFTIDSDIPKVLNREEVVRPLNENTLAEAKSALSIALDEVLISSPYIKRDRRVNFLYSETTGYIFSVHSDICSTDETSEKLFQIEIEYEGFLGDKRRHINIDLVNEQFMYLNAHIEQILQKQNFTILPTQTTKESWAKNSLK